MNSESLATSFIECFCRADLNGIDALLSPSFHLEGPLYVFDSKQAYIKSLEGNLEADPDAEIISVISNENHAAAFFRYKGNMIGQMFWCREGKLDRTLLVFDTHQVGA